MNLEQVISHRPHTGINLDKLSNKYMNAEDFHHETHRISLMYLSDTKDHIEDIDDVCNEIRDKDYQVTVEYNSHNISDRDIQLLIEKKDLGEVFETRQHQVSMNEYMDMRMMGLDANASRHQNHWICEKSFIKENITINITNKHLLTSIEKKFADGKRLEYTKDSCNYELVTTTKIVEQEIIIDEDVEECIERCGYMCDADNVDVWHHGSRSRITLTKYREID